MFAFHVMFVMKEVQDKLRQSICFFLSNYHVSPQNIPRNCCFTPLCIWLDDLLAENAWSCGNLESNIAFVALRKLVHLWGFFWCLKKFSRRYDHRSSLSSRFIILKHLEFRICTLEFLSVMRGLSCLYVYHNMSICVCQVSVCHSMSRWLMTFLDIMMYQSMFVCLAFHCFQCQQISGNKHLMHVTKTGNLTHPTQKKIWHLYGKDNSFI